MVEEGVHALQNRLHVAALDLLGEHIVHAQLPRLFEQAHGVAVLLDADGEVVVRRALGPAHVRHLAEHRAGGIAHVVGAQVEVRVEVHDAELRRAALVLEVIVLALKVAEGRLVTAAEHDGEEPAAQYLLDREAQLTLALLKRDLVADDVARVEELDLLRKGAGQVRHLTAHEVRRERRAGAALVARHALVAAKADKGKAERPVERRTAVVEIERLHPLVPAEGVVIAVAVYAALPAGHGADIMIQKHEKASNPKIYSSSLRTARNASVGTCTVPRLRIFFLPERAAPFRRLRRRHSTHAAAAAARLRSQEGKNHSSSLRTARNASVGTCTVPRLRIFFLPSFCFSSSFFLRVMSPP